MTNLDIVVIETLNRLLVTCNDCDYGFRLAAEHVESPDLQALLRSYSNQRQAFAVALQKAIATYGGWPATSGTAAASLHRGWMNLKSVLTRYDDQAVLLECTKGEHYALRIYNEALQQNPPLPGQAYLLVVEQQRWTQATLEYIETLRPASLLEAVV